MPDGIADHKFIDLRYGGINSKVIPNAAWFEVKAKYGNVYTSTSDYQIEGHLRNLAASNPLAVNTNTAQLFMVTTSNVTLSPRLATYAQSLGIKIHHITAKYKMVGGQMKIGFDLKY